VCSRFREKCTQKAKFVENVAQGERGRSWAAASGTVGQTPERTLFYSESSRGNHDVGFPLPAEILDHVVDHLHDTRRVLRNCCLVSKSWVPRARRHLFAEIMFPTVRSMQLWKGRFPDPSMSPAHYAKILTIYCSQAITAADADVGGWIRGFSSVVHLELGSHTDFRESVISLVPLHGFSPTLKSLRVTAPYIPTSHIFDLILSFPLLEDLAVIIVYGEPIDGGDDSDWLPTRAQPSGPSVFTGSLELLGGGMKHFTRRLLSLPGGIHFRKLSLRWLREGDLPLTTVLVEGCSHTLESLQITCDPTGASVLSVSAPAPTAHFRSQVGRRHLRSTS
jgi:hypothetical protein